MVVGLPETLYNLALYVWCQRLFFGSRQLRCYTSVVLSGDDRTAVLLKVENMSTVFEDACKTVAKIASIRFRAVTTALFNNSFCCIDFFNNFGLLQ